MEREQIEYETVTVQVPKLLMDYLRSHERDMNMTAKEYLEVTIVDCVRADIDCNHLDPKQVADSWRLNPIFKAIINTEII